jgi:hypothetical protein
MIKMLSPPKRSITILAVALFAGETGAQASCTLPGTSCVNNTVNLTALPGTVTATGYTWAVIPGTAPLGSPGSVTTTVSFPTTGTFTVTLHISSNTGTSSATRTISVLPFPVVTVTPSIDTVCHFSPAHLSASGADTYTWSFPDGQKLNGASVVYQPSVSITYTLTGTASGCASSVTGSLVLGTIPNISTSVSSFSACQGSVVTATAFGALRYRWLPGNVLTPTASLGPGVHKLFASNGGSCVDSVSLLIGMASCTSLDENALKPVTVWVGAEGEIIIRTVNSVSGELSIYGLGGELLFRQRIQTVGKDATQVRFNPGRAGIYLIHLSDGSGRGLVKKIAIEY